MRESRRVSCLGQLESKEEVARFTTGQLFFPFFFFFFGDLSSHPIISNGMRAAGSSSTPLDTPTQGAAIN